MENKYIITLEEIPFERFHSYNVPSERLYRVQGFNSLVFDGNGLSKLTPYTEPNLEAIRDEAYEKGVQDTKQHWVDAPRSCAYRLGYENGLNDAWKVARKIVHLQWDGAWAGVDEVEKWFDTYTASEAIEGIKAYEQEQQIAIGDEVVFYNGEKCVVTVVEDGQVAEVMDKGGFSMRMDDGLRNSMKKTGRHFPEIAEVLKKMKMDLGILSIIRQAQ